MVARRIEEKLRAAFNPEKLLVVDESHQHRGHAGWKEGGETHFRIEMKSAAFLNRSRLERQRDVYRVLASEMEEGIHALALSLEP